MLPGMTGFRGPVAQWPNATIYEVIKSLELTGDLSWALDPGASASYPGTGQDYFDLSGNGNHWRLGQAPEGVTQLAPTFVGVAGRQSAGEYFLGGPENEEHIRFLTTEAAWIAGAHKQNALFTFAGWHYIVNSDPDNNGAVLIDNNRVDFALPGFSIYVTRFEAHELTFEISTGSVYQVIAESSIPTPLNQWVFLAVSYNEATGAFVIQTNSTQDTGTETYTAPSSADPARNPIIRAPVDAGARLAATAWWTRALSAAELLALYNATKAKFGH